MGILIFIWSGVSSTGDGAWSEWTDEGCGVTCGEGVRSLTRTCTNPAPTFGGADCVGEGIMTESCNETPCPGQ